MPIPSAALLAGLLTLLSAPALSQDNGPVSALESPARGAPLAVTAAEPVGAGGPFGGSTSPRRGIAYPVAIAARDGEAPAGIAPLPRDLFTSDDFYIDAALWDDPRYFRCNSALALDSLYGGYDATPDLIGDNPPDIAPWGHCERDYPRESIVSPYPFATAQAHYAALMAEAEARGGPGAMPPGAGTWSGRYTLNFDGLPQWMNMHLNQVPTILSLLTEEYRIRFVQQAYHVAVSQAPQWPASYCWPEGFLRYFSGAPAPFIDLYVLPEQVMFITAFADNFIRQVQLGRDFVMDGPVPRLGAPVARWYGETVGFWDGDVLVTWTSNIQGWTANASFEFSDLMQTIEIYTPRYGEDGAMVGLRHETVFYDPEALVEPVRLLRDLDRQGALNAGEPFAFIECNPTIYPVDGVPQYEAAGSAFELHQPDWFNRPWAQIWEYYHEEGMARPDRTPDLFGF